MSSQKNSNVKIASLVILAFLAIPALYFNLSNKEPGQVLGVSENTNSQTEGTIGSGAREVVEENTNQQKEYTGKALWDSNQKEEIIANNVFSLGQSIKVGQKNTDKSEHYVIDNLREGLASDVLLIVNTETFIKLGGNPEADNSVNISITIE